MLPAHMDLDILIRWPVSVEILLLDALVVIFQQKNMVLVQSDADLANQKWTHNRQQTRILQDRDA